MNIDSAARVVHCLAMARLDAAPGWDSWATIADQLRQQGYPWPALADLAAMRDAGQQGPGRDDAGQQALAGLADQTRDDQPPLDFWETVSGLVGYCWQQGHIDAALGTGRLDGLWQVVVPLHLKGQSRNRGLAVIGGGVGLWASWEHADVQEQAVELMREAVGLIPADPFDGPVCHTILDAVY